MILEPKKRKSITVSIVSPSSCHEMMGLDAMIFVEFQVSFLVSLKDCCHNNSEFKKKCLM